MHLSHVSIVKYLEAARHTHELSETERTRGASSDALLIDPLEPLDIGEDKPWTLLVYIMAWKTLPTHIHAIALHRFDGWSLGSGW